LKKMYVALLIRVPGKGKSRKRVRQKNEVMREAQKRKNLGPERKQSEVWAAKKECVIERCNV
jgi:hypothetical protein